MAESRKETPTLVLLPTPVDYVLAPWYLRVRWWCKSLVQRWCASFQDMNSPEQANQFWSVR